MSTPFPLRMEALSRQRERLGSEMQALKTRLERADTAMTSAWARRSSAEARRGDLRTHMRDLEDAGHGLRCALKEMEADLAALEGDTRQSSQAGIRLQEELRTLRIQLKQAFKETNEAEMRVHELEVLLFDTTLTQCQD